MPRNQLPVFYRGESNAKSYIESRLGLDGRRLVAALTEILEAGSSVLELGMGPGTDLLLLNEYFQVVGSDYSEGFIDCFRQQNKELEVIQLDAATISVSRRFDCVFSNKVLHHLSVSDLRKSLERQANIVGTGGIVFHSFWLGNGETVIAGLRFAKYMPAAIIGLFSEVGRVVSTAEYAELNSSDSFFVAARI